MKPGTHVLVVEDDPSIYKFAAEMELSYHQGLDVRCVPLAVFAFVGIESLGVPFPGEITLVAAGVYAGTTGKLSFASVVTARTIVGDDVGFGHWDGHRLLVRYGPYVWLRRAGTTPLDGLGRSASRYRRAGRS